MQKIIIQYFDQFILSYLQFRTKMYRQRNNNNKKSTSLSHLPSLEQAQKQKHMRCQCCKHLHYIDYNRQKRIRRENNLKAKIQKSIKAEGQNYLSQDAQQQLNQSKNFRKSSRSSLKLSKNQNSLLQLNNGESIYKNNYQKNQQLCANNDLMIIGEQPKFQDKNQSKLSSASQEKISSQKMLRFHSNSNTKLQIQVKLEGAIYEAIFFNREDILNVIQQIKSIVKAKK